MSSVTISSLTLAYPDGTIGLQDIDRARTEHVAEVPGRIAVLTGCDPHPRRSLLADKPQAWQII